MGREELIEVMAVAIANEYGDPSEYWSAYADPAQAALSAIEGAGFVVVPREPTDDMNSAGATDQSPNDATNTLDRMYGAVANIYRAMINAYSPKPSGVEDE